MVALLFLDIWYLSVCLQYITCTDHSPERAVNGGGVDSLDGSAAINTCVLMLEHGCQAYACTHTILCRRQAIGRCVSKRLGGRSMTVGVGSCKIHVHII